MKNLNDLYAKYRKGECSEKNFTDILAEFVFQSKQELFLSDMDEDEFSDFLIHTMGKTPDILRKYDARLSTFSSYFCGIIYSSHVFWLQKRRNADAKKRYTDFFESENYPEKEFMYGELEGENRFVVNEDCISVEQLEIRVKANLNLRYDFSGRQNHVSLPEPESDSEKRELNALSLHVLALKACTEITPPMVDRISEISGIDRTELEENLEKARESMSSKLRDISAIKKRRNAAYFHRKRFLAPGSPDNGKFDLYNNRWLNALSQLEEKGTRLSPSNVAVGHILGITPRRVAAIVNKAKKCYSDCHEDIFGNRKPEQKTGGR